MEMDASASSAPVTAPAAASVPVVPVPLLNRNFLLLWSGQTISQLGNQAYALAMAFWLMEKTGSASLMGLVMMFSSLPALLLSPFGGAFADRHSRIRIIIVCNLIAGCLLAAMTAAMWLMPEQVRLLVVGFFVTATLLGLNRSFFMPAVSATMPELVPREKLVAANSMTQLSVQASLSVGQLIGGILYRVVGAPVLFLLDTLSFFFAAGNASLIRIKERKRELGPERTSQEVFRAYKSDLAEGFRFVWKYKGFRYFLAAASLMNFFIMPVVVLFPFYVDRYLGKGSEWYGFLMAALSVGTICGFLLAGALRLRGPARAWTILTGMLIAPILYGTLGFMSIPYVALAGCFGFGLTMGVVNVNLMAIAQASTPTELRGRVMGLMAALGGGLAPIGMGLGGIMGDLTGKNVPLVYGICGALTVIVILATCFRRDTLDYLAWGRRDQTAAATV